MGELATTPSSSSHPASRQAIDLKWERARAFQDTWADDLQTLYRTRPYADAVLKARGGRSFAAHRALLRVRTRGVVRDALLGHTCLFRPYYRVPAPPLLLECVLAWAYTGTQPAYAAVAEALQRPVADVRACLAAEPVQDWRDYVATHYETLPKNDHAWYQALVSVRWPAMHKAPWRSLPRDARHQIVSLLYAGCLASTPCTVRAWLACAELLYTHAWPQAAQLVGAAACAHVTLHQASDLMAHAVQHDDQPLQAALLAWMCTSEAGTAVLPAVPPTLYPALAAQLAQHATASTRLAFLEAMYKAGTLPPAMHSIAAASFSAMLATERGQALLGTLPPFLDELVSILLTTLHAASAPSLYAMLVGDVMLADDRPVLQGHSWDVLEQARQAIIHYLQHHWVAARGAHAFDALPGWCLKELAAELHVDAQGLRAGPGPAPAPATMASDQSSVRGVTSAGLAQTRAPEQRGPANLYAAVLNKSAARTATR